MKEEDTTNKKPKKKMQLPKKANLSRRLKLGKASGKELEEILKTLRTGVYQTESSLDKDSSVNR